LWRLDSDTRGALTFLTGLSILLSQAVIGTLGAAEPSELLIGAGLMLCGLPVAGMGKKNGNGRNGTK